MPRKAVFYSIEGASIRKNSAFPPTIRFGAHYSATIHKRSLHSCDGPPTPDGGHFLARGGYYWRQMGWEKPSNERTDGADGARRWERQTIGTRLRRGLG